MIRAHALDRFGNRLPESSDRRIELRKVILERVIF